MLLSELLDIDKLRAEMRRKFVSVREHPLDPKLRIYNYTHEAAYEGEWTHEQKVCRGLIVRHLGYDAVVLARPFPKFFNYGEHLLGHETIPLDEPFSVTSKEDGSLGILYQAPDGPAIATRGSFESDQATWATEHLRASIPSPVIPESNLTRLFEIIYPENRIVLSYGEWKGLIHLATLDTETGLPVPETAWTGLRAETHPFERLEDLLGYVETADADNREGFVIYFPESDLRVKVKFEEYVKLHRILTGLSERRIWEHISEGGKIEDFIDGVPDEFYQFVHSVDQRLRMQHYLIMTGLRAKADHYIALNLPTRKDLALALSEEPDRGWIFRAVDGQWDKLSEAIWRSLKPVGNVTFRNDGDS
jgi:RNA ligase